MTYPARILVVEDDPFACDALSMLLDDEGFHVESACDGVDACQKLETFQPSLVLSDLEMPRMNGEELLDRVRQRFPAVPVIVMSTLSSTTGARLRARGATDYIEKPLEWTRLLEKLEDAMRHAVADA